MRVAIFSAYYWPEYAGTAPYITAPAEYLAKLGHEVHVAAAFPHYPEWREMEKRKFAATEEHNGVMIHRRWHTIPAKQSALGRGVYESSILATGVTQFAGLPRPDVIVGVSPALASATLARVGSAIYRRPYGLIVHDLFGKGVLQTGSAGEKLGSILDGVESRVARRAKRLLVLTDAFKDFFVSGGFDPDRIDVIPPWSLRDRPTVDVAEIRTKLGWSPNEFVCVHAGNLGKKQGLSNVIQAARVLHRSARSNIRFVIAGEGNERPRLEELAAEYRLPNVTFTGGLSDRDYDEVIAASDVLLLNQRPSVSDMSLPSKMTAYFAVGRPVVAAVDPESAASMAMQAAAAGPIVSPSDPAALAQELERLESDPDLRRRFGESARTYADAKLRSSVVLPRYARFVERLAE